MSEHDENGFEEDAMDLVNAIARMKADVMNLTRRTLREGVDEKQWKAYHKGFEEGLSDIRVRMSILENKRETFQAYLHQFMVHMSDVISRRAK